MPVAPGVESVGPPLTYPERVKRSARFHLDEHNSAVTLVAGATLGLEESMKPSVVLSVLAAVLVWSLAPARAANYTYDVDYLIGSSTVTGDIVTNCVGCGLTSSDVQSYSLSISGPLAFSISGAGSNFTSGSNLFASASNITFTPGSTDSIFNGSSGSLFFGSAGSVSGGTGSCTGPGCSGGLPNPCAVVSDNYGACSRGTLVAAMTDTSLVITTGNPAVTPLPAALPLFASGLSVVGLIGWLRKRTANTSVTA
jgi:hypothetical protein